MKIRNILLVALCLIASFGFGQKKEKFTENDAKQFYRTIQGDYKSMISDSVSVSLHFTPIWERENDRFHWLYMEAINDSTKEIIEQRILEIKPKSDKIFKVIVYKIKNPEMFAGKWGNRNYFDGFTQSILKCHRTYKFLKTKDFEYQTDLTNRKSLECFTKNDIIHFKFVQSDERFYIKRQIKGTYNINGYMFQKLPTDIG